MEQHAESSWTLALPGVIGDPLFIYQHLILCACSDQRLYAVDRETQTIHWSIPLNWHLPHTPLPSPSQNVRASLLLKDGMLYTVSETRHLLSAFDASNGVEHWNVPLNLLDQSKWLNRERYGPKRRFYPDEVYTLHVAALQIKDELLFFDVTITRGSGVRYGGVAVIDLQTRSLQWFIMTGEGAFSPVMTDGPLLHVIEEEPHRWSSLTTFDLQTGKKLYQNEAWDGFGSEAISMGKELLIIEGGSLVSIDGLRGKMLWHLDIPEGEIESFQWFQADASRVYLWGRHSSANDHNTDPTLLVVERSTQRLLWSFICKQAQHSCGLAIDGQTIFTLWEGRHDEVYVFMLDPKTGDVWRQICIQGCQGCRVGPTVVDGWVYFIGKNGLLYAVSPT